MLWLSTSQYYRVSRGFEFLIVSGSTQSLVLNDLGSRMVSEPSQLRSPHSLWVLTVSNLWLSRVPFKVSDSSQFWAPFSLGFRTVSNPPRCRIPHGLGSLTVSDPLQLRSPTLIYIYCDLLSINIYIGPTLRTFPGLYNVGTGSGAWLQSVYAAACYQ